MSEWIVIPNWDKFQHYHDRAPLWIKVYTDLSSRQEWIDLTLPARGLLVSLWLEYARANGRLSTSNLHARLGQRVWKRHLQALSDAGFIELSASAPLAIRARTREREKEKETPKSPFQKKKARTTGWRMVRGSHGITYVPDPNGTDKPEVDARL